MTTQAASSLFINRELSWLAFNERVFEEAADPRTPLLERVKFVAIASSNRPASQSRLAYFSWTSW